MKFVCALTEQPRTTWMKNKNYDKRLKKRETVRKITRDKKLRNRANKISAGLLKQRQFCMI